LRMVPSGSRPRRGGKPSHVAAADTTGEPEDG
jgi:hypothetical protein